MGAPSTDAAPQAHNPNTRKVIPAELEKVSPGGGTRQKRLNQQHSLRQLMSTTKQQEQIKYEKLAQQDPLENNSSKDHDPDANNPTTPGRPPLWRRLSGKRLSIGNFLPSSQRKLVKHVHFADEDGTDDIAEVVCTLPELSDAEHQLAYWSPIELKRSCAQALRQAELLSRADTNLIPYLAFCYGYALLPAQDTNETEQNEAQDEPDAANNKNISTPEDALKYCYGQKRSPARKKAHKRRMSALLSSPSSDDEEFGCSEDEEEFLLSSSSCYTIRGLERQLCPKMIECRKECQQSVLTLQKQLVHEKNKTSFGALQRKLMNTTSSGGSIGNSQNRDEALNNSHSPSTTESTTNTGNHNSCSIKITNDIIEKSLRKASCKGSNSARKFARLLGKTDASLAGIKSKPGTATAAC